MSECRTHHRLYTVASYVSSLVRVTHVALSAGSEATHADTVGVTRLQLLRRELSLHQPPPALETCRRRRQQHGNINTLHSPAPFSLSAGGYHAWSGLPSYL